MAGQTGKKPASRAKGDKGQQTRDRILSTARMLFNQNGVSDTAVFRIAQEMDISPGNLTYHFKSKSEMILALSDMLRGRIEGIMGELEAPLRAEVVITNMEAILREIWSYRFLFNSAVHVSQLDTELAMVIKDLQSMLCEILERYITEAISRKEMRQPAGIDGVRLLTENILSIWLHWLRMNNIFKPMQPEADRLALFEIMKHHYSMIEPYISKQFAHIFWTEIHSRYQEGAA